MLSGKRQWARLGENTDGQQVLFKVVDWCYRGEGNANLVLSLPKTQQILRIRKIEAPKTFIGKIFSWFLQLFSWNDMNQMENEARDVSFYSFIMAPLIGREFVQPAKSVYISRADIRKLNKELKSVRPHHRQVKQLEYGRATLFVDYAYLSNYWQNFNLCGSIFAVEIKPKQGWVPFEDRQYTKCPFCLNQYLKLKNGQTQHLSSYCPLDLFSGDKSRMCNAIKSLLQYPQNNLKIFKDGNYVYGEGFSTEHLNNALEEMFTDENIVRCTEEFCFMIHKTLTETFSSEDRCENNVEHDKASNKSQQISQVNKELSRALESLGTKCDFGESTLPKRCILERILNFQKLDTLGLNCVHSMYERRMRENRRRKCADMDNYAYVDALLSKFSANDIESKCALCVFESLTRSDEHDLETMLTPYLIAAVMRDCSIMMSFQRIANGAPERPNATANSNLTIIRSELAGTQFAVNIGVFDLYPKPLRAIDKHKKRNCKIQSACLDHLVS